MILFGTFTLLHLIGILFLHCLPGLCGAALFAYKGYGHARPDVGSLVRGIIATLCVFAGGFGGLILALCLHEQPVPKPRPRYDDFAATY